MGNKSAEIEHWLVDVIVCPTCRCSLDTCEEGLRCNLCRSIYRIENRIPILLNEANAREAERMETEEKLFADMATPKPDTAVKWRLAKSFLRSLVSRLVETSHPRLVLYAGCGMDDLSEVVCGPDTKLLNADIVFAAVDRERGPGAYGVCCDLRRPPFARDSFDLILAVDVLHHFAVDGLDEPIGMLAAALKPGGMMLIMEPNVYYLYRLPIVWMPHRLRNLLRKMKRVVTGSRSGPAPHEAPMAPSAIVSILWRHSLSDIETVSCPIYFPGAVGSLLAGFLRRFPKIGNKLAYHFCFLATKAK